MTWNTKAQPSFCRLVPTWERYPATNQIIDPSLSGSVQCNTGPKTHFLLGFAKPSLFPQGLQPKPLSLLFLRKGQTCFFSYLHKRTKTFYHSFKTTRPCDFYCTVLCTGTKTFLSGPSWVSSRHQHKSKPLYCYETNSKHERNDPLLISQAHQSRDSRWNTRICQLWNPSDLHLILMPFVMRVCAEVRNLRSISKQATQKERQSHKIYVLRQECLCPQDRIYDLSLTQSHVVWQSRTPTGGRERERERVASHIFHSQSLGL